MVQTKEERKAKAKEYSLRPEVKAKRKAYSKVYLEKPEVKAKRKSYDSRPGKKAKTQEYNAKPETKARKKEYSLRPEIKAKAKDSQQKIRSNILQKYSKLLSNSNVPCCRCCGRNTHVDFLALDHIAGKKQMDSEPKLVKLGYSSELSGKTLQKWIVDNNFPDGFQILCQNCNFAKGMTKNNNECPLEGKPH